MSTVEDMWAAPLSAVDDLYQKLDAELSASSNSLLDEKSFEGKADLELSAEVLKDIVLTRLAERDKRAEDAGKATRKQTLLGVLARKQDEKLEKMSEAAIKKLIEDL